MIALQKNGCAETYEPQFKHKSEFKWNINITPVPLFFLLKSIIKQPVVYEMIVQAYENMHKH